MRLSDASASRSAAADAASDFQQYEPWMGEPPASFDDWLDGRLKTLYQTVLNEPLPPEIMGLLGGQKKSDGNN